MLNIISCFILCQTLDGKFGDGESEAHGKYSAKEGVRPNQARPQTNMQVCDIFLLLNCFKIEEIFLSVDNQLSIIQPHGRAEGESETRDRQETYF